MFEVSLSVLLQPKKIIFCQCQRNYSYYSFIYLFAIIVQTLVERWTGNMGEEKGCNMQLGFKLGLCNYVACAVHRALLR